MIVRGIELKLAGVPRETPTLPEIGQPFTSADMFFVLFAFAHYCNKILRDATRRNHATRNTEHEATRPFAPRVVRAKRPRPPMAPHARSLRDLGFRNHAA